MSQPPRPMLERVRHALVTDRVPATPGALARVIATSDSVLGSAEVLDRAAHAQAHLVGAGPLEPLLADPAVTDILVNGPGELWVDDGTGLHRRRLDLGGEADVRALAVRLAAAAGRRLDDASPAVDVLLPNGVRLHAVLPPLVGGGPHLSLRVPRHRGFALDELVRAGTVPPGWGPTLQELVRARLAFLVSGGTGVGKTTVLSTLLSQADPSERLVLVEDAPELKPALPHVVRLQARPANIEGSGGVELTELVRHALRMRPDRLVVGECRGPEVRDLLIALNTGHAGGCGTVHANSAGAVIARLEALGALAGLSRHAVHVQAASALQLVLHLERRAGVRRLVQIGLVRWDADRVVVVPAITAADDPEAPGTRGPVFEQFRHLLAGARQ